MCPHLQLGSEMFVVRADGEEDEESVGGRPAAGGRGSSARRPSRFQLPPELALPPTCAVVFVPKLYDFHT